MAWCKGDVYTDTHRLLYQNNLNIIVCSKKTATIALTLGPLHLSTRLFFLFFFSLEENKRAKSFGKLGVHHPYIVKRSFT